MIQEFKNINLQERNSFHVKQQAARLIEFETESDLHQIFNDTPPDSWYVMGGGNNILFTKDFDGTLIVPTSERIEILSDDKQELIVRVAAGLEWDDLVEWAVVRELWGVENLSLIPGKCGAAPIQNIGAYGSEVADVIERVEMFCVDTRNMLTLDNNMCDFGYRDSIFKRMLKGKVIITAIVIKLLYTPQPNLGYGDVIKEVETRGGATLRNIRDAICSIRNAKLPDTNKMGNAGSFFKNPIVENTIAQRLQQEYPEVPIYPLVDDSSRSKIAAGWLIDKAGMKGYREGAVAVHDRQALVLVNMGGATGGEVIEFAKVVERAVFDKFGIVISPEVNLL